MVRQFILSFCRKDLNTEERLDRKKYPCVLHSRQGCVKRKITQSVLHSRPLNDIESNKTKPTGACGWFCFTCTHRHRQTEEGQVRPHCYFHNNPKYPDERQQEVLPYCFQPCSSSWVQGDTSMSHRNRSSPRMQGHTSSAWKTTSRLVWGWALPDYRRCRESWRFQPRPCG